MLMETVTSCTEKQSSFLLIYLTPSSQGKYISVLIMQKRKPRDRQAKLHTLFSTTDLESVQTIHRVLVS